MKLCAIRLHNVRKFTDPIEVSGIQPGLNVLSAPNEQGKSTIFDALHAVFFKDAKSWDKDVRALMPHAGGEPNIQVEVDVDGSRYRIEKQFYKASGKGETRIWKAGTLFLQSDAAEGWLKKLVQPPKEGGPAGLLWVRQGVTSFEDAKETLQARRGLLSSVSGEVSAVTGGQKMDRIRHEIEAELDQLITKRGGARKNGPLDLAQVAVADLEERHAGLSQKAQELQAQLQERRQLRAELADLTDPADRQTQDRRLAEAKELVETAARQLEQLGQAQREIRMAQEALEGRLAQIAALKAQQKEVENAEGALRAMQQQLEQAQDAEDLAKQNFQPCQAAERAAQKDLQRAREDLDRIARLDDQVRVQERINVLTEQVRRAEELSREVLALTAASAQGPSGAELQKLQALEEAVMVARQVQQARAASLVVTYFPGQKGKFRLGGAPLDAGQRMLISHPTRIEVEGVGDLTIDPGQGVGRNEAETAEAALTDGLAVAGFETAEEMRKAVARRQRAEGQLKEARAKLEILAPNGVDPLQADLQGWLQKQKLAPPLPEEGEDSLPDREQLNARVSATQLAWEEARIKLEAAREALSGAQTATLLANSRLEEARQRCARAQAGTAENGQTVLARLTELEQGLPDLQAAYSRAQQAATGLQDQTIDMAQAQASLKRAESVVRGTQERVQEIGRLLASLDARVEAYSGDAVEEELSETAELLTRAKKRLQEVTFEVSVLQRLSLALEQASSAARDTYVGPILQELRPLLSLLWPGASLDVDADDLMPNQLERSGQADSFSSLSGGTREQIALLVRLAFARLLARAGRAAPVILDDAIVYTDDARIQKIFDALTYQATDLQILVFSCRQKAFKDLGGTRLAIRQASNRAPV